MIIIGINMSIRLTLPFQIIVRVPVCLFFYVRVGSKVTRPGASGVSVVVLRCDGEGVTLYVPKGTHGTMTFSETVD